MNDSRLCNDIKQNLEAQGIDVTEAEIQEIYASVLNGMSEMLDKGDIVDISGFGSFWKKKNADSSATFFQPDNDIRERINTLK